MTQRTYLSTRGSLVLASSGPAKAVSAAKGPPTCPLCQQAAKLEISRSGYLTESCRCGIRAVPRVPAPQFVEPPSPNPFTDAERVAPVGRPPRMVHCSVCKAEVSIHATDTRRRCMGCQSTVFARLWPKERQAALVADYQHLSYHDLRRKYECGYTTITRILTSAGIAIRTPGKRFRKTRPPVGMPRHREAA